MRFFPLLMLLTFSLHGFAENLLKNPGFERRNLEWISWGAKVSDSAYQGKYSIEVTNVIPKWSGMNQVLNLNDSISIVEISGWMKTSGIVGGKESWEKARISIEFLDHRDQIVGGYPQPVALTDGTTPWTFYSSRFAVKEGAKKVKLVIALGNCTGTAWYDELTCEFIKQSKQADRKDTSGNQLDNSGFEDIEGWNFFGSQTSATCHSGKYGLMVRNIKSEWNGADQNVILPSNASKITVSGWIKADGVVQGKLDYEKARISIEILDQSGNLINGYPPPTGETVGTHDWKQYSKSYSVPLSAKMVKVQCALGNATGTAWFDDIDLRVYDDKGNALKRSSLSGIMDEGEWFSLGEGSISGHYVDWSSLLDPPAGKHGFITVKNGRTVFKDGTTAKFWGTNLVAQDCFASDSAIDSLVDRLSKMGCNLLRLHHMDAPWATQNIFGNTESTRKLSDKSMRQLDYLISKCKNKGIYIFLDMLVHRQFTKQDSVENTPPDLGGKQVGFFSKKLIDLQKEYATQLLTHVNQFTKVAYNDEPAIIASEFINESTIFTHFSCDLITPPYRTELESLWKKSPYSNKKLASFGLDWSPQKGILKQSSNGDTKESLLFLSSLEKNYYKEMNEHFRKKLGVKYLLTGSNFPQPLLVSLRTNSDLDFIINNQYWDHPQVWKIGNDWNRILNAPFDNNSQLKNALDKNIIQSKVFYKVEGKPFMITEWNHCYPNEYLLEAVPLMASYSALQGWDGVMQFDFNLQTPGVDRIQNYKLSVAPEHLAQWVMAAPLFHRGDVKTAPGLFVEAISDSQVFSVPSYSSLLDKNYYLPYITKTTKSFSQKTSTPIETFRKFYDEKNNIINSETGELSIDANTGILQINTARLQGVTGFIKDRKFDFAFFSCSLSNTHASVYAVSADGKDLTKCKKFYLVAVGPVKMSSQQYNDSRTSLTDLGKLPVLAQVLNGKLTFKNMAKSTLSIVPLSLSGKKGNPIPASNIGQDKVFDLSKGKTQVYEVTVNKL